MRVIQAGGPAIPAPASLGGWRADNGYVRAQAAGPVLNEFGDATGAHQWIHVDPERAKQGPFGTPIAHGFMTLSLLRAFMGSRSRSPAPRWGELRPEPVRFMKLVPVDRSRRAHVELLSWEAMENGGAQLTFDLLVELDGASKPVCVAESILRYFP